MNSASSLRDQLGAILGPGLAVDPLGHAQQVAEIAGVLHEAFQREGLRCTLVGGSAIEVHAPGIYKSGDIDVVIEGPVQGLRGRIAEVFTALGFSSQGRHWSRGDLFVEVPSHMMEDPSEMVRAGSAVFAVVAKEVVLADRVGGFMHWRVTAYGQQVIDMLAAFGDNLDMSWLAPRPHREGSWDAFVRLGDLATSSAPVTEEVLQGLLGELRRRP